MESRNGFGYVVSTGTYGSAEYEGSSQEEWDVEYEFHQDFGRKALYCRQAFLGRSGTLSCQWTEADI
jgi:hypothetical protein